MIALATIRTAVGGGFGGGGWGGAHAGGQGDRADNPAANGLARDFAVESEYSPRRRAMAAVTQ
jgi:hypothetical protein